MVLLRKSKKKKKTHLTIRKMQSKKGSILIYQTDIIKMINDLARALRELDTHTAVISCYIKNHCKAAADFCRSGTEAQLRWALCFWVFHELQLRCWPELEGHLRLQRGRIHFQTRVVGCWLKAALSSLPQEPFFRQPEKESTSKRQSDTLLKLITEVTSNHLCFILSVRNESSSHTQGEANIQGHESQEVEITADCLRVNQPWQPTCLLRRTRLNNLQYQHTMVKTSVVNEKWCTPVCAWTWDHFSNYFTIVEWIKLTRLFCKQLWHHLCRNRIFFQNGIHLSIYTHIQIQKKRHGKRHIQSTDSSYHWKEMWVQGGGVEWRATFSFYSSYLFFAVFFFNSGNRFIYCTFVF